MCISVLVLKEVNELLYKNNKMHSIINKNPSARGLTILEIKVMKINLLLSVLFTCISYAYLAQAPVTQDKLFAQGMFEIDSPSEILETEAAIRLHPNVAVVRLDSYSNRFFILTKNISSLTDADLRSWFGAHAADLDCIQIGVHGIDEVNSFPFTNCQNVH